MTTKAHHFQTSEKPLDAGILKLSVCHIVSGDRWAGAEVQIACLIRELCRLSQVRVSAIVLNSGRLADELAQAGATVKVIEESQIGYLRTLRTALSFIQDQEVTILHSHRYKENMLAFTSALLLRVPVKVRTVHGMLEPHSGWQGIKQRLVHRADQWIGQAAVDAVIAVSSEMSDCLIEKYGPRKVVTVRNGIDQHLTASGLNYEDAKARIGCGRGPVIGFVGRLEPIKRVDLFLRMAKELSERVPGIEFIVAGDGSLRAPLESLAHRLGIGELTHFLGHRDDIHQVLRAFDVLVLCSDHEGLPITILEAMRAGVPVVGRGVGGISELLGADENGLCVHSADSGELVRACLRILREPALRMRLCRSAMHAIERNNSAEGNANRVIQLYRELCEA